MKKVIFTLCLMVFSTLISVFGQTIYVQEDFESYTLNTFPSNGGWILLHNGAGNSYQKVTDSHHHNGLKSMTLTGTPGWAAHMYKSIPHVPIMYVEIWMMASSYNTSIAEDMGRFQFYDIANTNEFPGVYFYSTSNVIKCHIGNTVSTVVDFVPNQWYKVNMKYDLINHNMDVWINDTLLITNLYGVAFSSYYDCFMLGAEHGNTTYYFDDIKVGDYDFFTGITEPNSRSTEMYLYPNPTNSILTLDELNPYHTKIKIFDMIGNEVGSYENTNSIDISFLPDGIYTIRIYSNNNILTQKIIKQ